MKKFLIFTTSLIAAVCATGFVGGGLAFAETAKADEADAGTPSGTEYYPTSFEKVPHFDSLEDYAVGDGKILFLENNKMSEYGNESVVTYQDHDKTVTRLYSEGGEFYYETNDDKVYALKNYGKDENPEIESFTSTTETQDILLTNKHNYFLSDGAYYFLDKNNPTEPSVLLEGLSNLKRYGETVYAVKDNVLYTLSGTEYAEVKVKDYEITNEIAVGNAYTALTSSTETPPQFVRLKSGAYMTEVNLDSLPENSSKFTTGNTVKATADAPSALLLYTAGDNEAGISIIAVKGKTYLIHPKDTTAKTVYPLKDSEFTDGTATEGFIYSAPYESKGTRIKNLPNGTAVKILKEIKATDNAELDYDFYYVEYKYEETTVKGYVRFGLISTYTFNEDPPVETPDPEESYEDVIKPVVLILLVLLLIAIAAGYLIYVGTSGKRKNKAVTESTDSTKRDKK